MFRMIEEGLSLPSEAFIHVGNKFRSDYLNPRLKGWKSIFVSRKHSLVQMNIPPKFRRGSSRPKAFEEIIQALEVPVAPKNSSPYFRLAYDYLAPLLIIFSVPAALVLGILGIVYDSNKLLAVITTLVSGGFVLFFLSRVM